MKMGSNFFGIVFEMDISEVTIVEDKHLAYEFTKASMLNTEIFGGSIDIKIYMVQTKNGYVVDIDGNKVFRRTSAEGIIDISTHCIKLLALEALRQIDVQDEIENMVK